MAEGEVLELRACVCGCPVEAHDHRVGCTSEGCECKWLGKHAKRSEPPAAPLTVQLVLAGKVRSLAEMAAAANTILRETNCADLAEGAQSMAEMIVKQRGELKKLREELAAKTRATVVVNIAKVRSGTVGDVAESIRKVLEQHGLED